MSLFGGAAIAPPPTTVDAADDFGGFGGAVGNTTAGAMAGGDDPFGLEALSPPRATASAAVAAIAAPPTSAEVPFDAWLRSLPDLQWVLSTTLALPGAGTPSAGTAGGDNAFGGFAPPSAQGGLTADLAFGLS